MDATGLRRGAPEIYRYTHLLLVLPLTLCYPWNPYADYFSGPVVSVLDGDTIDVLHTTPILSASTSAASTTLRPSLRTEGQASRICPPAFGKEVMIQPTATTSAVYLDTPTTDGYSGRIHRPASGFDQREDPSRSPDGSRCSGHRPTGDKGSH
jgi:hypothetical protein